jgi:hypothetical protein
VELVVGDQEGEEGEEVVLEGSNLYVLYHYEPMTLLVMD